MYAQTYIIECSKLQRTDEMDYISTAQAAKKWGISERRVQRLYVDNRIDGAIRFSRIWAIPKDAKKPVDPRKKAK